MMDVRNPDVRGELLREDEARRSKRSAQMIWAAVPVAAVIALLGGGGVVGIVAVGCAAGYATSLLLVKVFPAKQLFGFLKPGN